jgi:hypothetical protein
MGWDRGRYYTRSKKVNGRVRREYVGMGPMAQMAAELDALAREQRQLEAQAVHQEKVALAALDADLKALAKIVDLLVAAVMLASGFHLHKRGEWRKRRGHHDQ